MFIPCLIVSPSLNSFFNGSLIQMFSFSENSFIVGGDTTTVYEFLFYPALFFYTANSMQCIVKINWITVRTYVILGFRTFIHQEQQSIHSIATLTLFKGVFSPFRPPVTHIHTFMSHIFKILVDLVGYPAFLLLIMKA